MMKFAKKIYYILPTKYREIILKFYRAYSIIIGKIKFAFFFPILRNCKVQNINHFEQKIYSQNGEDGIINIIFSKIGIENKFCVEFGVDDGFESNTRFLIEDQGWSYLHMDGSDNESLYTDIKKEFITAENINLLFKKYNVPETFDLLSIDLDYNTYWVWKAISGYEPRVVVIEYNSSIPLNENKVVKYDPNGVWDKTQYFGASLLALVKLGRSKGYTLIGCENNGVNAFFIKDNLIKDFFVKKGIEDMYKPPSYGKKINGKYGHPATSKEFIADLI